MFIRSWLVGFVLSGSILLNGSAWGGTSAIEGIVKDPKGRPVKDAELRIEPRSNSNLTKIVKTDPSGHYISSGLPTGTYKVTLVVGGVVKASINNATIKSGNPTQLNFDLKTSSVAGSGGKKGKHMVWMPARTGSHMGGNWVEADGGAAAPEAQNVETMSAEAMQRFQQRQTNPNNTGSIGR